MKRASERRREGDKVVPLSRAKGARFCPQSGTTLSGKGGQDRLPNKEQELRKEHQRAFAPDLPDEGQSGATRSADQGLVFVPRGICFVRDWDDRLGQLGMATLERSLSMSSHAVKLGFWLPARTPAPEGNAEWQQQLGLLRHLIDDHENQSCHSTSALEWSKVTHVATPPAPCEGMGKPFPLDPKPGARLRARRLA